MNGNINTKEDIEFLITQLKNLKLSNKQGDKIRYKYSITRIQKARSDNQRRYMWLVNSMIAKELSMTPDEVHYSILAHLRIVLKFDARGKERKVIQGTKEMNIKQQEEYMEDVRRWAITEIDFYIPLPNEIPESVYYDYKIY